MRSTVLTDTPTSTAAPDEATASPEELELAIRTCLENERIVDAQRTAARAAELYQDHPWLAKANRVLNPTKITPVPADAPDRSREFEWLRRNSEEYRGRWVALHDGELIASSYRFEEVLAEVRARDLATRPLVHRVE